MQPSAPPNLVDAAYRQMSKLYHPDMDPSPGAHERMKRINEAWTVLKDPAARKAYDAKLGLNGNSTAEYHPSNTKGDAEESPARARPSAAPNAECHPSNTKEDAEESPARVRPSAAPNRDVGKKRVSADELLNQWYWQLSWIRRRFFLPKEFAASVEARGGDTAVCYKTTVETLTMRDTRTERDLRRREADRYWTDLNYKPNIFKKETLEILSQRWEIDCYGCGGKGDRTCGECEKGTVSCDREMPCRSCCGKGYHVRDCEECTWGFSGPKKCASCKGVGRYRVRCPDCRGQGETRCERCDGKGRRECNKCRGNGKLKCDLCKGDRKLVRAIIIKRTFSPDRKVTFNVGDLAPNQFPNGLKAKHFQGLHGRAVNREKKEFGALRGQDIASRQREVQAYDLVLHQFCYKGKHFQLNRITSTKGPKYVASRLPWTLRLPFLIGGKR